MTTAIVWARVAARPRRRARRLAGSAQAQSSGGTVSPGDGTTTTPHPPRPPRPRPAPGGPTQVFPIPTAHTFGDGFGAGRGHQGADIFAPCGTMAIAVMNAKVVYSGFQGAAGNYVVIRNKPR